MVQKVWPFEHGKPRGGLEKPKTKQNRTKHRTKAKKTKPNRKDQTEPKYFGSVSVLVIQKPNQEDKE